MKSLHPVPSGSPALSRKQAEVLLAAVILARSTSLVLSKLGLAEMGPFTLLALRSLTAFLLLLPLLGRRLAALSPAALLRGMLLGGLLFAVMGTELTALGLTASSTVAFLENTAIVLVPVLEAALHRAPPRRDALLSAGITLAGIALLTLGGGRLVPGAGEGLCLLTALLYALSIILTHRLSRQDDPLLLGFLQVGFMGVFSLAAALLLEQPRLPASPVQWGVILALAVVCSGFGFTLQPLAQRYTTSERAGLFCALNPLASALLGCVFLGERLGLWGFMGAALVMTGILLSLLSPGQDAKQPDFRPAGRR